MRISDCASATMNYSWNTAGAAGGVHQLVADDNPTNDTRSQEVQVSPSPASWLRVADLDATTTASGKRQSSAQASILVRTGNGVPVNRATVTGTFSQGDRRSQMSGVTLANGWITVDSGIFPGAQPNGTFTITKVQHPTLSYNPTANIDPESDSNGTTIALSK